MCDWGGGPNSLANYAFLNRREDEVVRERENNPDRPAPDEPGFCAACGVPLATDKAALAHLSEALEIERANGARRKRHYTRITKR